jgi:chloramphenicol-sensitive protein RarD
MPDSRRSDVRGLLLGVGAYGFWGFVPLYFKAVREVAPLEVLAHRVVWSVVTVGLIAAATRRLPAILAAARQPGRLPRLALSSVLVAANWLLFIWAVTSGRILESSLGYYINPIVSVVLGCLFLRERLDAVEWTSVGLAAVAVLWLTVSLGVFPVLPLALAFSFAFYALVRKKVGVGSLEGLALETLILLPAAAAYLVWRAQQGTLAFGHGGWRRDLLLLAAGPVTTIPLLLFTGAVRRLRLATMGLLQYISPSLQLLLAVFLYGEPFGGPRTVAFVLIWCALLVYALHNWRRAALDRVVVTTD